MHIRANESSRPTTKKSTQQELDELKAMVAELERQVEALTDTPIGPPIEDSIVAKVAEQFGVTPTVYFSQAGDSAAARKVSAAYARLRKIGIKDPERSLGKVVMK